MDYINRFFNLTYQEPNTGCWLWGGSVNSDGYGRLNIKSLPSTIRSAHRLSYQIHNGIFDYSLHVLHKCDNPCCVNPEHLFLGTHLDNIADRTKKGRTRNPIMKGLQCWNAKLNPSIIKEIQSLPKGTPQKLIAKQFGIAQSSVSRIRNKQVWLWI